MIVSHSKHGVGWLLHDDRSYYSVIVMHDGFKFTDGLREPLRGEYRTYCETNISLDTDKSNALREGE